MVRLTPNGTDIHLARNKKAYVLPDGVGEDICGKCGHTQKYHPALNKKKKNYHCDYITNFAGVFGAKKKEGDNYKSWCGCDGFISQLEHVLEEASTTKLTEFIGEEAER